MGVWTMSLRRTSVVSVDSTMKAVAQIVKFLVTTAL